MSKLIILTSLVLALSVGVATAQAPVVAIARFYEVQASHSSLGDFRGATESFRGQIILTRNRKPVGASFISCVRMSVTTRNCYATYALPEGTMAALGLIGSWDRYSLTIVGGTGAYLDYHGWASVQGLGGTQSELTFHLHKLSDG